MSIMPRSIAKQIIKSGCGKAELTTRQNELYEFIWDKSNWRPPCLRQMREFLHYSSDGGVYGMMKQILKKGWKLPEMSRRKH